MLQDDVTLLTADEVEVQADLLIRFLDTSTNEVSVLSSPAPGILATAVNGKAGPTATAIICKFL